MPFYGDIDGVFFDSVELKKCMERNKCCDMTNMLSKPSSRREVRLWIIFSDSLFRLWRVWLATTYASG